MTLTQKIIALISFMMVVMLTVFWWFASHMYRHMDHFTKSRMSEKETMLEKYENGVKKLNNKAENMGKEITSFVGGMEEGLQRLQKESEEFDKQFLEKQNSVFDAIDNFTGEKK